LCRYIVVEDFLDAAALGEIYAASLLNVHPCSYDAAGLYALHPVYTQRASVWFQ
jgi:hypothetical protein